MAAAPKKDDLAAKFQAAAAAAKATAAIANTAKRIQLPEGVTAPALEQHPVVVAAAGEVAHVKLLIERGEPERQKARDEVASLQKRADSKRLEAGAIRSRRLAQHEEEGDAAALHLLEADAHDLDGMVEAARGRLRALEQPLAALRQRLTEAQQKLKVAQVEAALHGQADRLRAMEQALIAGYRELRVSLFTTQRTNMPGYYAASKDLRNLTLGTLV